jgi:hypothetical protein
MDITIQGIFLGLLALAIGLGFAFYGFRLFLILLPIWGFFVGFLLGANGVAALFGDAFLATALGWVTGFLLGILFAVLSYLYYWLAVILLGGALGYQLTLGFLQWINPDFDGFVAFLLALAVGAIFAVGFAVLRMPAVLVIVATAIAGAGAAVAGVIVALGLVKETSLESGIWGVYQTDDLGVIWLIAAIALAFAGGVYQARAATTLSATITEEQYMNPGIDRGGPSGTAAA